MGSSLSLEVWPRDIAEDAHGRWEGARRLPRRVPALRQVTSGSRACADEAAGMKTSAQW